MALKPPSKSPFGNYDSNNGVRQESSINAKISVSKKEKLQHVYIVSRYFLTRYLLGTKGIIISVQQQRNLANTTLTK